MTDRRPRSEFSVLSCSKDEFYEADIQEEFRRKSSRSPRR